MVLEDMHLSPGRLLDLFFRVDNRVDHPGHSGQDKGRETFRHKVETVNFIVLVINRLSLNKDRGFQMGRNPSDKVLIMANQGEKVKFFEYHLV
jgi:hypothetical protein